MEKIVRESIGFERGGDPRKTMRVGKLTKLKEKYGREDLDELLIDASRSGNLEDVKYLVEQESVDVEVEDNEPLLSAARYGHLDVVKYLVEQGGNIHEDEEYALNYAANNGHLDVVKYLVEQGANISGAGYGAITGAAEYGRLDVLKYLISQDPNVMEIQHIVELALEFAEGNGHQRVVRYLKSILNGYE